MVHDAKIGFVLILLLSVSTMPAAKSARAPGSSPARSAVLIAELKFRDVTEIRIEAAWRPIPAAITLENGDITIPSGSPVRVARPQHGGKVCVLVPIEQKVVLNALKGISSARGLGVDPKGSFFVFLKLKTGKTISVALPIANDDNGARHVVLVDNYPASIDLMNLNEVRRLAVRGGCVPFEPQP